jgi:hypothetical protein
MASRTSSEEVAVAGDRDIASGNGQEVEEYDCGCKIHFRQLDYGETSDEVPRGKLLVPEFLPCSKHKGAQAVPLDARLVRVRREHESFLNE